MPINSERDDDSKRLGRRSVLKAAAWSVPVVSAAIATPLNAGSVGGGLLYLFGNAIADEYFALSLNYDPSWATIPYPAGSITLTITLPDIPGTVDTFSPAPSAFITTRQGTVLTSVNTVAFLPGSGVRYTSNLQVTGAFPFGARYTIRFSPASLNYAFIGNMDPDGIFLLPR